MANLTQPVLKFNRHTYTNDELIHNYVQIHCSDHLTTALQSDYSFKKVSPFIQIEFHNDSNVIDIGNTVKDYLISGNILNYHFFYYIMSFYHNIDISESDYSIKVMDMNITMREFTRNDIIEITHDGYNIKTNLDEEAEDQDLVDS